MIKCLLSVNFTAGENKRIKISKSIMVACSFSGGSKTGLEKTADFEPINNFNQPCFEEMENLQCLNFGRRRDIHAGNWIHAFNEQIMASYSTERDLHRQRKGTSLQKCVIVYFPSRYL